jgi:hypothetical protein
MFILLTFVERIIVFGLNITLLAIIGVVKFWIVIQSFMIVIQIICCILVIVGILIYMNKFLFMMIFWRINMTTSLKIIRKWRFIDIFSIFFSLMVVFLIRSLIFIYNFILLLGAFRIHQTVQIIY